MDLTLATNEVDGATIIAVGGEIDVYTAPKLRDKITELVAGGVYDLIVDVPSTWPADPIFFGAVGHPALGTLAGQPSLLAPVAGVLRGGRRPARVPGRARHARGVERARRGRSRWAGRSRSTTSSSSPARRWPTSTACRAGGVRRHRQRRPPRASGGAGTPIDAVWPKLTGDWTVTVPAIGTWGGGEDQGDRRGTRRAACTPTSPAPTRCAAADWPQFHHDPANSGDGRRDAFAPGHAAERGGRPTDAHLQAPGDDLLCGTAKRYEASVEGAAFAEGGPRAEGGRAKRSR